MRLHFSEDWLRRRLEKLGEAGIDDPPCGVMACSPEIYEEMTKMTTQVKVEITQQNIPVVVEIVLGNGDVVSSTSLHGTGASVTEYLHSNRWIRVREATAQELAIPAPPKDGE